MKRTSIAIATCLLSTLVLAACGVPIDSSARVLPQNEIPSALQRPTPTTPAPKNGNCAGCVPVTIWFVRNGLLNPGSGIDVPKGYSVSNLLQALDGGPDTNERNQLIESYLPPQANLAYLGSSGPRHSIANINLGNSYGGTGPQVLVELAQIVFTVTRNPLGIAAVQFWLHGNPVDVPSGTGALATGAVGQCDYTEQLPVQLIQPLGLARCATGSTSLRAANPS
jgi:hypothetical protein